MGTQINKSLNVIKCIAAFSVICIHCQIDQYGSLGIGITALTAFSVPIFFLISGFYSYYEDNIKGMSKYKTRIFRLIKLLVISNIIYLTLGILNHTFDLWDITSMFNLQSCFNILVFNSTLTFNNSPIAGHLWFIEALIYCYLLFYIMNKFKISHKKLYTYIPILIIARIMLTELYFCFGLSNPMGLEPFFLRGLPFFTLGYLIHDKKEKITTNISNKFIILTILISCLFAIFETFAIEKFIKITMGAIILAIMLFIWCVKNPDKLNLRIFEWIGNKLYMYIYILHLIAIYLLLYFNIDFGYFNVIIAIILSTIMAFIAYIINKNASKLTKKIFHNLRNC